MKKIKWFVIAIIVLIVFLLIGKAAGWFGKEEAVKVICEKVQKRTIIESIPANGKIQPVTEVKISPDVSGEIVELNVKEGQAVNKGELLLKIKPEVYISAMNRMEATLNSSKAQLGQVEAQFIQMEQNYKRTKTLYDQKVVSQSDFEDVESQYKAMIKQVESSKFNVASSQAALDEAQENLNKTSIYAPMSGTISKLDVEKGERVVGTSQMAGTEMLRIANLDAMEALIDVNENDIVRVKLNDTALIEIDAYPGRVFKGVVTEVANSATTTTTTDQVTNFEVKIFALPESYNSLISETNPYPFRPGMSASVYIQTEIRNDVLSIPIQAITTRSDLEVATDSTQTDNSIQTTSESGIPKTKEMVFVVNGDEVKVVEIETGLQDNNYIEIISGLNEGDEIVVQPYAAIARQLKNKSKIEKTTLDKELNKK